MNLIQRVGKALAPAPLARALAHEVLASPWADTSNLSKLTFDEVFGTLGEGILVNRSKAMELAVVAGVRHTIATTIGRLPLYTARGNARTDYQSPLWTQPEGTVPLSTTLAWTVDALIFYPCTWWVIRERDAAGWPIRVEWVDRPRAELDRDGHLVKVDQQPVAARDVIRFDSPLGTGFLGHGRALVQRAIVVERAVALAEDNPVPTTELHSESNAELTQREIDDLLKQWQENRRKRGAAYTSKSLTVKTHGQHPEQLMIEGRRAIQQELARALNVPPWIANLAVEGQSFTYENRASRNWELIDLALAPYLAAIADRLTMADVTPRGWRVKFDTDELTRPDQKTRFETYAIGKNADFVTQEQINAWEGWTSES